MQVSVIRRLALVAVLMWPMACGGSSPTNPSTQTTSVPSITTQPANQAPAQGGSASFVVSASANPAPTYQWQLSTNAGVTFTDLANTPPYSGATTGVLTVTSVPSSLNGALYRCVVTNTVGSVTSTAASLMVNAATITSCETITAPGSYSVTTDLVGEGPKNGYCLTFKNTAGIRLDCGGHSVTGMDVETVDTFAMTNCNVELSPKGALGLGNNIGFLGLELTNVTLDHDVFNGGLIIIRSQQVNISNSHVSGDGILLFTVSTANISNNVVDYSHPPVGRTSSSGGITLQNGSNNRVIGNTIDGGWDGNFGTWGTRGADDGIILNIETGDTVEGNTIRNVWDAGVEGVANVSNTSITNNTISNTLQGLGAWYDANWRGNTVSGNSVSQAARMFEFFYDGRAGVAPCVFTDNRFVNNRFTGIGNRNPSGAPGTRGGLVFPAGCEVGNNLIQGNDFGGQSLSFVPSAGFIIIGGGT